MMTWSIPAMPLRMLAPSVRWPVSLAASRLRGQETNRGDVNAFGHVATNVSARGGERSRADAGFGACPRARQLALGWLLRFASERARLGAHRRFWHRQAAAAVDQRRADGDLFSFGWTRNQTRAARGRAFRPE